MRSEIARRVPAGGAATVPAVLAALLASVAVAAAGPCAGAAERSDPVVRRHAVRCLVNEARAARGLPRLRPHRALTRAAGRHARDMVRRGFFEHRSPGGSTPYSRARRAGYRGASVGETIAFAVGPKATPAGTVRDWLRSGAHRRVLFGPGLRHAGVGVARGAPLPGGSTRRGATVVLDVGGGS